MICFDILILGVFFSSQSITELLLVYNFTHSNISKRVSGEAKAILQKLLDNAHFADVLKIYKYFNTILQKMPMLVVYK